jgi:prepilin-type N-terminal cleavage/methylation domain-containing protein
MSKTSSRSAFTLVELLIVITIIGILSVALIPRLVGAPARARDAQRRTDVQTIATALELYADDEGAYPAPPVGATACVGLDGFEALLTDYLSSYPVDPVPTNGIGSCNTEANGGYLYVRSENGYLVLAKLENTKATGPGVYETASPSSPATSTTQEILSALTLCEAGDCETNGAMYVVGR